MFPVALRLVLRHQPYIGGDAGVVEAVVGQLYNGIQPVIFDQIAANLAGAGTCVAREQAGAVLDDRHMAVLFQLCHAIEHKQELAIALGRQTGAESTAAAQLGFLLDIGGFALPVDAKGRIGDDVVKLHVSEFIVVKGVAKLHVVRVAATDKHISLGDAVGEGVNLLTKADDLCFLVQQLHALFHTGEHLAGAHGHVVYGHSLPFALFICGIAGEQVAHQIDDVTAGEVGTGLFVVAFRETLDEILENIAHVHGRDLFRFHIGIFCAEIRNHLIEQTGIGHALHLRKEIHARQNVDDVIGKTIEVCFKIDLDVIRVSFELLKGVFAGVVKTVVASRFAQKHILDGQMLDALVGFNNGIVIGQQAIMETLHNDHGQNDKAVLMGLVCAKKRIGYIPDERCFFLNVNSNLLNPLIDIHRRIAPYESVR